MFQTEQPQNGGVQVVEVNSIVDSAQTEFVRVADDMATLHAASGHPYREAIRVVPNPVV